MRGSAFGVRCWRYSSHGDIHNCGCISYCSKHYIDVGKGSSWRSAYLRAVMRRSAFWSGTKRMLTFPTAERGMTENLVGPKR